MSLRGILAAAAIGVLCTGSVFADEMPFALTTTGSASSLPDGADLTFTGTSASGSTNSNGVAANINLGQFTLTPPPAAAGNIYYTGSFDLNVTFSVPIETGSTYSASITGRVNYRNGAIDINFSPDSRLFTFTNNSGSGSFNLNVHDIYGFAPGKTAATQTLYGSITNATFESATETPEPSTLALMVSSVLGAVLLRRKKLANRA